MPKNTKPQHYESPSVRQLTIATAIAFVVATILMVAVVLPAEYGRDPTGIGTVLGLTAMGEIKQSAGE